MIAQLIQEQIGDFGNWGMAGALSHRAAGATAIVLGLLHATVGLKAVAAMKGDGMGAWRGLRGTLCVLVAVYLLAPLAIVVIISFSSAPFLQFPPPGLSLRWYRNLFGDAGWINSLMVSVEVLVPSSLMATLLGTAAAYALVRGRIPGAALITACLMLPIVVPASSRPPALFGVYRGLGLNGTLTGLIIGHTVLIAALRGGHGRRLAAHARCTAGAGGADARCPALGRFPPHHAAADIARRCCRGCSSPWWCRSTSSSSRCSSARRAFARCRCRCGRTCGAISIRPSPPIASLCFVFALLALLLEMACCAARHRHGPRS